MTTLRFRNIDADPADPLETWPPEAFQAAIERGLLPDWQRIADHIASDPFGSVAAELEHVLSYTEGVGAHLLRARLARARREAVAALVRADMSDIAAGVQASGMGRAEFARRVGTSESRLSTWLSGSQFPSAATVAKMRLALHPELGKRE